MKRPLPSRCWCGRDQSYANCCGLYHSGALAEDAETLMRSRYSAYALELESYLLATWHPDTRPERLHLGTSAGPVWRGLEVKRHQVLTADEAVVEFIARYKSNGRAHRMHEISRFVRQAGVWFYLDGKMPGDLTPAAR